MAKRSIIKLADEIRHMALTACYSSDPDAGKRSRILLLVFIREIISHENDIATTITLQEFKACNGASLCSKSNAMMLAKVAARKNVSFGKVIF